MFSLASLPDHDWIIDASYQVKHERGRGWAVVLCCWYMEASGDGAQKEYWEAAASEWFDTKKGAVSALLNKRFQ